MSYDHIFLGAQGEEHAYQGLEEPFVSNKDILFSEEGEEQA
jgi:hypothetical protein